MDLQGFMVVFFCFSLLFTMVTTIDPIIPSLKTEEYTFQINETHKSFSNQNVGNSALLTPFDFTSLSETIILTSNYPNNTDQGVLGSYSISTSYKMLFYFHLIVKEPTDTYLLPVLGPCAHNGLTYKQQQVWTSVDFSIYDLTGIKMNFSVSRVYRDAILYPHVSQWMIFGMSYLSLDNNYYAITVPGGPNVSLQIDIRRHNDTVPLPSIFFNSLSLATDNKCLNRGAPNNQSGIIETINLDGSTSEVVSNIFSASLLGNSTVFVVVDRKNIPMTYYLDKAYSINATFVMTAPNHPSPPPDHFYIVISVVGIVVFIGVVGIVIYLFKKRTYYSKLY